MLRGAKEEAAARDYGHRRAAGPAGAAAAPAITTAAAAAAIATAAAAIATAAAADDPAATPLYQRVVHL